jgi:hypothetical protein
MDMSIDGKLIKSGKSNIFYFSTKEEIINDIAKLRKVCKEKNLKLFAFSTENMGDETSENVIFNESENGSQIYKKLIYFVGLCEKGILENQEIVIVINRADLIDKAFLTFESDIGDRIKKHLQETFLQLISFGNALVVYKLESKVNY